PEDDQEVIVVTGTFLDGLIDNRHVFRSVNGGVAWQNITGNLPVRAIPQSLAVDWGTTTPTLFVGTLKGVWSTTTSLTNWAIYGTNLPNGIVQDLQFDPQLQLL